MNNNQQNNRPFDAVLTIPCTDLDDFYIGWVTFLKPVHGMSDFPCKVFAYLLRERCELIQRGIDSTVVDTIVFSKDIEHKLCDKLGIDIQRFYAALSLLRKSGVLSGRHINQRFVPNCTSEQDFKFMVYFTYDNKSK